MRHGDSRGSALWGKGEGRWRRAIVCLTAVAALCAPASALAVPKAAAPTVAPTVEPVAEVVEPGADAATVFDWFANWTW
jgi:anti-sigma-K factor RskA